MRSRRFVDSVMRRRGALLVVTALVLSGCAVIGPQSITAGRGTYTEVINRTEDEQMLNALVRLRYDETFGMMSVSSVTANLRFRTRAGADIGIGDSENFVGNLVPLSAGVAYEENPTISYVPLSGEDFTRRMLSPVSLSEWLLFENAATEPSFLFALAVRRVNGLRNPILGQEAPSPAVQRLLALYGELRASGVLDIAVDPASKAAPVFYWDIHNYEPAHRDSVSELLDLLGIEMKLDGSVILLPLRQAIDSTGPAVNVQTRSALDVLQIFGSGIEIPSRHLEAKIVEPRPAAMQFMHIRSSESRPKNATVQIQFRDQWFYIDATDAQTKRIFLLLQAFIGSRLAGPGAGRQAPVLTVPVN
jgi:hypothetical protein